MGESHKTLTPTFIVYLNGTRFSVDQESSVKQIIISDRINVPSSCQIVMSDHSRRWADDADFEEGSLLSVHLGYKDHVQEVFNGEIIGIDMRLRKGSDTTMTIRCMNVLHRLKRVKKHRIFSETTDTDIFKEIVQENGLSLEIDEIGGEQLFLIQRDITDYEFLLGAASRYGCKLWAREKTVYFKKNNDADDQEVILEWGKTLNEFSARTDSSSILTEVQVMGWDSGGGESFTGTAAYSNVDALGGSHFGGKAVEDNFGASVLTITDSRVTDAVEAEKLALDTISENAMNYVQGSGTCEGHNAILAGNLISIKETGGRFSGDYLVTAARHNFHASLGYTTSFSVARNSV